MKPENRARRRPLQVLITVDTEIWPMLDSADPTQLDREFEVHILGKTARGSFGLPYQMELLKHFGLKAVYHVESLFAYCAGSKWLTETVGLVQQYGQEVQLHIHTEWLRRMTRPLLASGATGQNIRDFSLDDQSEIVRLALASLKEAGAQNVTAYRAGNFGANRETLTALVRNGVMYDSSHNPDYDGGVWKLSEPWLQPVKVDGVWELPVSSFTDYPGHLRPLQICACSSAEMEHVLWEAWRAGWQSAVVVSHSFEFVHLPATSKEEAAPRKIAIERYERLCRFLSTNKEAFQTVGFNDLDPAELAQPAPARPISSSLLRTAGRMAEQLVTRLMR